MYICDPTSRLDLKVELPRSQPLSSKPTVQNEGDGQPLQNRARKLDREKRVAPQRVKIRAIRIITNQTWKQDRYGDWKKLQTPKRFFDEARQIQQFASLVRVHHCGMCKNHLLRETVGVNEAKQRLQQPIAEEEQQNLEVSKQGLLLQESLRRRCPEGEDEEASFIFVAS